MTAARRNLLTVALYGSLSAFWTWPLCLDPGRLYLSRQHDHYGMIWVAHAAGEYGLNLGTTALRWPLGKQLILLDSFIWAFIARLTHAWLDPVLLLSLFTLLGPVLSAWAAERYAARGLGAAWPFSLLAGACFGFGGIAASAILDGHIYFLLVPWLPLLALHWGRATSASGRIADGLLAGVWWILCLLTSGYLGIDATLVVVVFLLGALFRRRLRWRAILAAAALALPAGIAFLAFVAGGRPQREETAVHADAAQKVMEAGSADLANLVAWFPEADLLQNSLTPVICMTALVLALLAPRVLGQDPGWRAALAAGLLALLLAFGPTFRLVESPEGLGPPWLLRPLCWAMLGDWFHFPARLLWVTNLMLGAVAAAVLTRLGRRAGWTRPALLALGFTEVLLGTGLRQRLALEPTGIPSAYESLPRDGALLEFVPDFHQQLAFSPFYFQVMMLHCTYQRAHDLPLFNDCISPAKAHRTQLVVGDWFQARLLADAPVDELEAELAELGAGSVAFHPDLFPPASGRR